MLEYDQTVLENLINMAINTQIKNGSVIRE